jgi:hypothetical protein
MKLKLTNVRLSFPDLFTPTTVQGQGKPAYRAQFLVPEAGALKAQIDAAIREVARAKWGAKADGILAANEGIPNKSCWIDGKRRTYDGYAGNWALSTTRGEDKGPPLRFTADKVLLEKDTGVLYAGCYVNASVQFWCQDNQHGKAVRCELLGVQFAGHGDAFGGGGTPNPDDFDSVAEGAGADALV